MGEDIRDRFYDPVQCRRCKGKGYVKKFGITWLITVFSDENNPDNQEKCLDCHGTGYIEAIELN